MFIISDSRLRSMCGYGVFFTRRTISKSSKGKVIGDCCGGVDVRKLHPLNNVKPNTTCVTVYFGSHM